MKILKFKFENKSLEWRLEELSFNKLTLLVGASGVGKTQILNALLSLKRIASGGSMNGAAWFVEFETLDKRKYVWEGEFENQEMALLYDSENDENKRNKSKIVYEKLLLNNEVIVSRVNNKIVLGGLPIIKLSQEESILNLLKEEDTVKPAHDEFLKLYLSNNSTQQNKKLYFDFLNLNNLLAKYNTLASIQESQLATPSKLFFVSHAHERTFLLIKQRFIDIFPQVQDIKISPLESKNNEMPDGFKDVLFIQIKEQGVKNWINQSRISSGMFRTLIQLSELYLCAEGTVFLIDEFENSLGINCINEITNDILSTKRNVQFVITSHHPYIIDAIGFNYWKLITRNAGVVKAHDIDKFNLGKSKHSAFMQLLQLEEYQTGQEQI
ncbi:MAG: ATP-binding protein [Bernardetiaceae bacterium]|jgi:predicted ATPase|nr:ATP-binding protein [Bernardetiaceae bacterium]